MQGEQRKIAVGYRAIHAKSSTAVLISIYKKAPSFEKDEAKHSIITGKQPS